ncbi:MAG: S53 family peptidase [Nocardioidaceae bacterium]
MTARLSRHHRAHSLYTHPIRTTVASALAVSVAAVAPVAANASTGARPSAASARLAQHVGGPSNRGAHHSFVVTLVTGDRVAVTRLGSGRVGARFLPGSPSIGAGQQVTAGMGHAYVLPRTLTRADTLNLDTSLFDVLALRRMTRTDGSVPVTVTFTRGTSGHQVRGLQVDLGSAHTNASGRIVARASYTKASTRAAGQPRAWRGVASVRLAGARPMTAPARGSSKYELHTLTVKFVDSSGAALPFGDAVVQNVDDTRLYFADAFFGKAGIKLSVPNGNYAVIATDFSHRGFRVAVNGQFSVTDDMKLVLSTADSTSKAGVSVPGAKAKEVDFVYLRNDAKNGSFGSFYGSVPSAPLLVNPVKPSDVTVGTLTSQVRSHLAAGARTTFDTIQGFNGIPADLDLAYPRSAFGRQHNRYYSDERGRHSFRVDFRFLPGDFFDFESGVPFTRPSVWDNYFLGNPNATWWPLVEAYFHYPPFRDAVMFGRPHTYQAAEAVDADWFKGPIRPGVGHSIRSAPTGFACSACRTGDTMRFFLDSLTDSMPSHAGAYYAGKGPRWTISSNGRLLASGRYMPFGFLKVPAAEKTYKLDASVVPDVKVWTQSTRAHDVWTFKSKHGKGPLPLIFPRYRLPVTLLGRAKHDVMRFRLDLPHLARAAGPRITSASLRLSYNGGITWQPADLSRIDQDTYKVRVDNPSASKKTYATIEVKATDAAGNAVTERINHAYVVPLKLSRPAARPASDRSDRHDWKPACGRPAPLHLRCFALVRSGVQHLSFAADPKGYGPQELRGAYNLPRGTGAGQTLAVVVAYDAPTAEADLAHYRKQFGLPPCTTANGCFTKLNQDGEQGNYPHKDAGWALEAGLDLAMASSACPKCHLVLVEANVSTIRSVAKAVDTAVASGASVVNNSYGAQEGAYVHRFSAHYDVPGVTMVASSGDFGYGPANFPANVPAVVSAGGTALHHAANARGWRENAWWGAGSGCSAYFAKPAYQTDPSCHMRTVADISAVAAPSTGVAVYDSFGFGPFHGWFVVGGTSVSSPLIAGMVAAAGAGSTLDPADLYASPGSFYDVTKGTNGFCKHNYMCEAHPGYDAPTGLGTPRGLAAF